jgi:deazaflavin-dependent oxidoreductase (nitroreductase family)
MAETRERRPMNWYEKGAENFAKTKVGGWYYVNVANRLDRAILPLTRGRFSASGRVVPVGLLTTIGAKSGKVRKIPLVYLPIGEKVVLVASKAGAVKNPAWYHNLKANPEVTFLGQKGKREYVCHEAEGAERDDLWVDVNDLYAGYETYQGRAGERRIPVMVLEPK